MESVRRVAVMATNREPLEQSIEEGVSNAFTLLEVTAVDAAVNRQWHVVRKILDALDILVTIQRPPTTPLPRPDPKNANGPLTPTGG